MDLGNILNALKGKFNIFQLLANQHAIEDVLTSLRKELEEVDVNIDIKVEAGVIHIIGNIDAKNAVKVDQLRHLNMLVQGLQGKHPKLFAMLKISLVVGQKTMLLTGNIGVEK